MALKTVLFFLLLSMSPGYAAGPESAAAPAVESSYQQRQLKGMKKALAFYLSLERAGGWPPA